PGRGGSISSVGKGRSRPAFPAPPQREEAYPELWDQAPGVLLRLLERSGCGPGQEFAARALRENQESCPGLDVESLRMLAGRPAEPAARLGLDLAVGRFDPAQPDPRLVLLLVDSPLTDALRQAREWIDEHWGILRGDPALVVGLVTSPRAKIRVF